jgi:hypothetical protein
MNEENLYAAAKEDENISSAGTLSHPNESNFFLYPFLDFILLFVTKNIFSYPLHVVWREFPPLLQSMNHPFERKINVYQ